MGSGIDEFLKAEGIFEEAQALAIKEVVLATCSGNEGKEDLEEPHGNPDEDEPHANRPPAGWQRGRHLIQSAKGCVHGWAADFHTTGLIKKARSFTFDAAFRSSHSNS